MEILFWKYSSQQKLIFAFLMVVTCQLRQLATQPAWLAKFHLTCTTDVCTTALSVLLPALWNVPVTPERLTFFPSSSPLLSLLSELLVFLSLLTFPFSEAPPHRHHRSSTEKQTEAVFIRTQLYSTKQPSTPSRKYDSPHNNNTDTEISWVQLACCTKHEGLRTRILKAWWCMSYFSRIHYCILNNFLPPTLFLVLWLLSFFVGLSVWLIYQCLIGNMH